MKRSSPTPTVVAAPVVLTATLPPLTRHMSPREATAPGIVTVSIVKHVLASSWMNRLHSGTVAPAAMPSTVAFLMIVFVIAAPPVGFASEPTDVSVHVKVDEE